MILGVQMEFCRQDLAYSSAYGTLWSQQSTKPNEIDTQHLQDFFKLRVTQIKSLLNKHAFIRIIFRTFLWNQLTILHSNLLVIVDSFDKCYPIASDGCDLPGFLPCCSTNTPRALVMQQSCGAWGNYSNSDNNECDSTLEMNLTRNVNTMRREHREMQHSSLQPLMLFLHNLGYMTWS